MSFLIGQCFKISIVFVEHYDCRLENGASQFIPWRPHKTSPSLPFKKIKLRLEGGGGRISSPYKGALILLGPILILRGIYNLTFFSKNRGRGNYGRQAIWRDTARKLFHELRFFYHILFWFEFLMTTLMLVYFVQENFAPKRVYDIYKFNISQPLHRCFILF